MVFYKVLIFKGLLGSLAAFVCVLKFGIKCFLVSDGLVISNNVFKCLRRARRHRSALALITLISPHTSFPTCPNVRKESYSIPVHGCSEPVVADTELKLDADSWELEFVCM